MYGAKNWENLSDEIAISDINATSTIFFINCFMKMSYVLANDSNDEDQESDDSEYENGIHPVEWSEDLWNYDTGVVPSWTVQVCGFIQELIIVKQLEVRHVWVDVIVQFCWKIQVNGINFLIAQIRRTTKQ